MDALWKVNSELVWYCGTITDVIGDQFHIEFDDGDTGWYDWIKGS